VKLLGERNMLHSYRTASTSSEPATPNTTPSPNTPPPAKRRRHAKHAAHSHDAGADGLYRGLIALGLWQKFVFVLTVKECGIIYGTVWV